MPIGYSRYTNKLLVFGDLCVLNIAFILAYMVINRSTLYDVRDQLSLLLAVNVVWIILSTYFELAVIPRHVGDEEVFLKLFKAIVLLFVVLLSVFYFIKNFEFTPTLILSQCIFFAVLLFIWRFTVARLLKFLRLKGLNFRRIIIVGGGHQVMDMYRFFTSQAHYGYRILGCFSFSREELITPEFKITTMPKLKEFCISQKIDEIYCSLSGVDNDRISDLFRFADQNLIRFKLIPDFKGFFNKKVIIDFYGLIPVLVMRTEPLESIKNRIVKRMFDIFVSLMVILFIFPVLFTVFAIMIKLSSKGPVFFRQKRSGKNNEEFTCLKFRTMRVNTEADEKQATRNDPRITGIGRFLRKTSLDELPQFFNTLIGDMSIVGPRPHMLRHTKEYSKMIDKFMVRHFAKPGITGWAQVKGFRGDTLDPALMEQRVELDVWYVENYSFLLDIKIIFLTILVIIRGQKEAF